MSPTFRRNSLSLAVVLCYAVLIVLALLQGVEFRVRAWAMLLIVYGMGTMALGRAGLTGSGRLFVFAVPIVAVVLVGVRSGILMAALSVLTMALFTFLAQRGVLAVWITRQVSPVGEYEWAVQATYMGTLLIAVMSLVILFLRFQLQTLSSEARTARDLKQERDFGQSILDTAQAIILVLDREGNILRFNPFLEELSGRPLAEVKGRNWFDVFLPDGERQARREEFVKSVGVEGSTANSYRLLTKSGEVRRIEHWSRALKDHEGRVIGVLSVGIDVTEREASARERDEHRRMLDALLDTTPDIIIFKDAQHRFRACSQTIARILGRSRQEMVGKTDFDLFPGEQAQDFWNEEVRVMEGREAIRVEHQLDAPDGPHWFETIKMPMLDAAGQVVGLLSAERDITRRKEADEALRRGREQLEQAVQERTAELAAAIESQNRLLDEFRAVLDGIDYGIILMGPDLRTQMANRAVREMWGLPEELIARGVTLADLINFNRDSGLYDVAPGQWESYVESRTEMVRRGRTVPTQFRRRDGLVLEFQVMELPNGGRMLTYFDITELVRQNEELQRAREIGGDGDSGEERFPGDNEPRNPDAYERRHRDDGAVARHAAVGTTARVRDHHSSER